MPASGNGMPKTVVATMTAVAPPAMAHQWGPHAQAGEQAEQHEDRQRGDERGRAASCAADRRPGSRPWLTSRVECSGAGELSTRLRGG